MIDKSTYQPPCTITPAIVNLVAQISEAVGRLSAFADGNGRMGRLWQTLILSRWNPLFADIPVESLVCEHQAEYYQALQASTD